MRSDPLSREQLDQRLRDDPVVLVGIGRREAGDDVFGVMVAQKLDDCPPLTTINAGIVPESFLGKILAVGTDRTGPPTVVFADAADLQATPGELRWLSPREVAVTHLGTHAAPSAILDYLQAHGCTVYLLCAQAEHLGTGRAPSLACLRAADAVASAFRAYFQTRDA